MTQHDSNVAAVAAAGVLLSAGGTIFGIPTDALLGGLLGAVAALSSRDTKGVPWGDKVGILIAGVALAAWAAPGAVIHLGLAGLPNERTWLQVAGGVCGLLGHIALPEMSKAGRAITTAAAKRFQRWVEGGGQ